MATITPVQVGGTASAVVTKAAASGGGDSVHNALGATLVVKNADASSHTVTLTSVRACSLGLTGSAHNVAVPVAAGVEVEIPIPAHCVDPATGYCAVTYTAVTSMTVAAVRD